MAGRFRRGNFDFLEQLQQPHMQWSIAQVGSIVSTSIGKKYQQERATILAPFAAEKNSLTQS